MTNARRLEAGKNVRREITVQPDGNGTVTIVLPATTDCAAQGAVCTEDGRMLSRQAGVNRLWAERVSTAVSGQQKKARAHGRPGAATARPRPRDAPNRREWRERKEEAISVPRSVRMDGRPERSPANRFPTSPAEGPPRCRDSAYSTTETTTPSPRTSRSGSSGFRRSRGCHGRRWPADLVPIATPYGFGSWAVHGPTTSTAKRCWSWPPA